MHLNTRLDRLGDYPFARLAQLLANIAPRANATPVAMSVGEPQHEPPAFVAETIAANAHLWNKYPPMAGSEEFRAAAAAWLARRYNLPPGLVTPERHVLPVSGTKEALFLIGLLAVPEEKRGARPLALLPNPYYLVYAGSAAMSGAEIRYLPCTADHDFLPDLDALDAATLDRTALFFLCSPANPQGTVAGLAYLRKAIALARRHDFVLVVDECYAEIYDRAAPPGGLEACAAMGEGLGNVVVFHSLSKRSSAAGLRSGFVAGDPELIAGFLRLRNYGGTQVPMPLQAAAAALWREESHVEENRAAYRRKFDAAEGVLKGKFGFYRPPGGFFLWLDVGDGEAAAVKLWREAAIRTLPGAYVSYAGPGEANPGARFIRLALVHDEATIAAALERMVRVL